MEKKGFFHSLPFKLIVGVAVGLIVGLLLNSAPENAFTTGCLNVLVSLKYIFNQLIMFCVPLIIIGFIAPSITRLGNNASRMLAVAVVIAYCSTLGAALFSMTSGYVLIPNLSIVTDPAGLKSLPDAVFELNIPQIMPVMSALVFSIMIGVAAVWAKAEVVTKFLEEFQRIVLALVTKIIIPLLPVYIGFVFCALAYEGSITQQLPAFLQIIAIVMVGHFIWMAVIYGLASLYSHENPWEVVKHYGPAYLTAVGTMSSAATLAVALQCADKAKPLRKDMVQFGVPLFANIHLCGSVLTETFFVMAISQMLYGAIPSLPTMLLFCALLGIFAIGAPGVPGGTVMASLGLITGVLGFGDSGTALMLAIFALQDSFGTACNVTTDGALTLILSGYANKHNMEQQDLKAVEL